MLKLEQSMTLMCRTGIRLQKTNGVWASKEIELQIQGHSKDLKRCMLPGNSLNPPYTHEKYSVCAAL